MRVIRLDAYPWSVMEEELNQFSHAVAAEEERRGRQLMEHELIDLRENMEKWKEKKTMLLSDVAERVAELGDVKVKWKAADPEYDPRNLKMDQTVAGALAELAATVGAIVVWDGIGTFVIREPDRR